MEMYINMDYDTCRFRPYLLEWTFSFRSSGFWVFELLISVWSLNTYENHLLIKLAVFLHFKFILRIVTLTPKQSHLANAESLKIKILLFDIIVNIYRVNLNDSNIQVHMLKFVLVQATKGRLRKLIYNIYVMNLLWKLVNLLKWCTVVYNNV